MGKKRDIERAIKFQQLQREQQQQQLNNIEKKVRTLEFKIKEQERKQDLVKQKLREHIKRIMQKNVWTKTRLEVDFEEFEKNHDIKYTRCLAEVNRPKPQRKSVVIIPQKIK